MNMKAYLEQMGILNPKAVYRNLAPAELVEHALERGEGKLCSTGAFVINTGKYTGRSPMIVSSLMNLPCIILLTGAR